MTMLKLLITDSIYRAREMQVITSASIGRSTDNTIRVEDVGVGRQHALIEMRVDGAWLSDLGSTNGTFVNGRQILTAYRLQGGDQITIGSGASIQVIEIAERNSSAFRSSVQMRPPTVVAPIQTAIRRNDKRSNIHLVFVGVGILLVFTITGIVIQQVMKPKRPSSYHGSSLPVPWGKMPEPPANPNATPMLSPSASVVPVDKVSILVSDLALQITGKSRNYYRFDPAMIAEIKKLTGEYRVDVTRQAQEAKADIVRAFSSAYGLKPLFGFILAMSQSKFQPSNGGQEVGYWRVPLATALEYEPGANLTSLNQPEQAANLAAQCWGDARSVFTADEDFMYVIACFGMPRAKAGELEAALQDVSDEERRDFWKMVKAGIVSPGGAERVMRFFAAGIVGQNPSFFQLPAAKPLSDL